METTFSVTVQTPLKNLFLFTLKPLWKHLFFTTKTAFFVTVQTPLKHFFVTLKPLWRHIFFVEIIFFPTVQPPLKHFFSHSVLKHFGNTSFSHRWNTVEILCTHVFFQTIEATFLLTNETSLKHRASIVLTCTVETCNRCETFFVFTVEAPPWENRWNNFFSP